MRSKILFLAAVPTVGTLFFASLGSQILAGEKDRVTPIPNSSVILLPSPEITRTASNAEPQQITPAAPPAIESTTVAPPASDCDHPGGCANGMCEPYYRDRPKGDKDRKRHIIINNRAGEPEWYKHYRCNQFGYYPTQWAAWPEGWLMCRNPQPGDHPYDRRQPSTKEPLHRFDKSGKMPNTSTGKQGIDNLKPTPNRDQLRKEPDLLPEGLTPKKQEDRTPPPRKQADKKG